MVRSTPYCNLTLVVTQPPYKVAAGFLTLHMEAREGRDRHLILVNIPGQAVMISSFGRPCPLPSTLCPLPLALYPLPSALVPLSRIKCTTSEGRL